jgi:hypothetical protein
MIAFIEDHRGAHGVEPICKVLPIAPSTYHSHVAKRRDPARLSARARQDAALKIEVRRVFDQNFGVYGVRKVWRQLKREGFDVARCTVTRLMRDMGLQGVIRGKPVKTTISDKAAPCPLDHVNRQFKAPRPNVLWLSDFTYVATWTGFVYVAFVIDAQAAWHQRCSDLQPSRGPGGTSRLRNVRRSHFFAFRAFRDARSDADLADPPRPSPVSYDAMPRRAAAAWSIVHRQPNGTPSDQPVGPNRPSFPSIQPCAHMCRSDWPAPS